MWNRMDNSWQDPWKDGQQNGRGWYQHPTDTECQPQFDTYGWQGAQRAWQAGGNLYQDCSSQMPSNVGVGGYVGRDGMMGDPGGMEAHHSMPGMGLQGRGPWSDVNHQSYGMNGGGHHNPHGHGALGNHSQMAGAPGASARPFNNGMYGAPVTNGHGHTPGGCAAARPPTGSPHRSGVHSDDDGAMMADLEESMRAMLPRDDGSDDEDRNARPAEATAEEREEAEQVVRQAFKEAKERDRLREKVKRGLGQEDLQAMINARINRSSGR